MATPAIAPPARANKLLRLFCPAELLETIEGDLLEQYQSDLDDLTVRAANRLYYGRVLSFLRPGIILRNKISHPMINTALIYTHLKVTFRNIRRHFGYAAINMFGLGAGVAACLLIFCYTKYQKSYDDFHPDIERLYRVNQTAIWTAEGGIMSSTAPPLAERLITDYPEVEASTRINTPGNYEVRYETQSGQLIVYQENEVLAADSNFFDFFGIELQYGDKATALKGKNKVIMTPETAARYFNGENALGQLILLGDARTPVEVSGITKPLPPNMHFDFDLLISIYTNPGIKRFEWSWIWTQVVTYTKLKPDADLAVLTSKMNTLQSSHVKSTFSRIGMDYDNFMKGKGSWQYFLQPVRDIHLHSTESGNRIGSLGNIRTVNTFQALALLILLIAIINFVNLATARASRRGKEIGVKKVMGAMKGSLITQFQIESVLITTIACLLGIPLLFLLRTALLRFAGIDIPIEILGQPEYLVLAPLAPLIIGMIAGIYPAFYLTAFKPAAVLKGNLSSGVRSGLLRNILVTLQFAISIALIAGTAVVFHQISFMSNKNLGFERENILVINNADKMQQQMTSFRDEMQQVPGVMNAALAMDMPGRGSWEDIYGAEGSDKELPIAQLKVDEYFIPTMGMKIIEGRAFEQDRTIDHQGVVINETAAGLFGWTVAEALDHRIVYPESLPFDIIGVVNDFHSQSLHQNIQPLILFHEQARMWGDQRVVAIKFDNAQIETVLAAAEKSWTKRADQAPFEYAILDEELNTQYANEQQLGRLTSVFSGFAIFIAMLGLMGLVAYSAEQRKKEIGIRKVLGASVMRVFFLLNGQYFKLIVLGIIIAVPVTIWYLREWLADFAYRIDIGPGAFIFAAALVTVLALLSVSYLTLSAASVDPAKVLKDE